MKVTGEVHDAVPLHMDKRPRYPLNMTAGGRQCRYGNFNKDNFLVPASNPATSSSLSSPISATTKISL